MEYLGDILILVLVLGSIVLAARGIYKARKKGGCCGNCAGCSGCCGKKE